MKLYLYHHCPFCVRAQMVGNYKQVPYQTIFLLNDDEETCFRLVNAKQVPILEFDDGTAMPESLDIAKKFDAMGSPEKIIHPQQHADTILEHINTVYTNISNLLYPRFILIDLPEFKTQAAKDYFQRKKEVSIKHSFEQAIVETAMHKAAVEKMLATLPTLPQQTHDQISWDDVLIYPMLRNLSLIKGLQFPQAVLDYIENVKQLTQTETYFDRAV